MDTQTIQNVIGELGEQSFGDLEWEWRSHTKARQMFEGMIGGGGGGGSSGGSGGLSFVTPGTLYTLLGDIPIANNGDVITADYHNSLREALFALAAFLGQGSVAETQVVTYAPALIPFDIDHGHSGAWTLQPTGAVVSAGLLGGWLPVDLPDGVQLQKFILVNSRHGDLEDLNATLNCVPLETPTSAPTVLALVDVHGGTGAVRTDPAPINPGGSTDPAVIATLGRVDNSSYRYFIEVKTKALGGKGAKTDLATIYAFQISYSVQ
jgi:hypothetical protein